MKDSFLIYKSFYKPISRLSDKQLGRLFRAIFKYQLGEEVTVEEDIEMAFEFFKNQFEIDELKYQGIVERNRNNGRKGGNDKNSETVKSKSSGSQTSHSTQNNPVGAKRASGGLNDNDNDNDLKETSLSRSKEKEEDLDKDVDKPLTELREELLSNQTWIETLSMNNHIDENESMLYIEAYIRKLQNEGIARKSVSDAQQHFARWLIIELKRARDEQSGIHQKTNSKTKQERVEEFAKAIATKLATGDTGNIQDGGESALPF
ncbi:DUF6291 domain-containing protein [Barnesiella intestinihominis]|uniref:DUF6291 domain-containing protein n=1 Tax=Barnesiella intestinihominis TaxID=487174 RepID=UPI003AB27FFD